MCWTCLDLKHHTDIADDMAIAAKFRSGRVTRTERQQFSDRLWVYALDRLCGMIYNGTLSSVKLSHPFRPPSEEEMRALQHDSDTRQELVAEAISLVLPGFLKDLATGRSWSPTGGAAITTYWVHRVAGQLYRCIGNWANQRQKTLYESVRSEPLEFAPGVLVDVTTRLTQRWFLKKLLRGSTGTSKQRRLSKETRAVAGLYFSGYSRSETADKLRIKPTRVDYLLRRLRDEGKRLVEQLDIDPVLILGFQTTTRSATASAVGAAVNASSGHPVAPEDDPWSAWE